MEGIILAGGLGTRLRPRVNRIPKPMAAIAGRPFLCWLLDRLAQEGFRRIILSVGYGRAAIMNGLRSRHGNIELDYAVEEQPLGTGGAIRHAMLLLTPGLRSVWVMNGDTISALRHQEMLAAHAASSAHMTMALARIADASRYGAVVVRDNRVVSFATGGMPGAAVINSGTYLLSPKLFAGADWPEEFSFERDFLPWAMDRVHVGLFETAGWFLDIGIPEDFDRAQTELPVEFSRLTHETTLPHRQGYWAPAPN
jgi:D-glycero-alpha-D-manno-heptose 1-phosphate guanylyltransferase